MFEHVCGLWGTENRPRWSLDVTFREDTLRNRVGYSESSARGFRCDCPSMSIAAETTVPRWRFSIRASCRGA